jgi:hypothetical protein
MDILFIYSPVTLLTRVISASAGGQAFARGPGESEPSLVFTEGLYNCLSNFRKEKMNIKRQRFKNTQRASQPGVTAVEIRDPTVADEDLGVLTRDLL